MRCASPPKVEPSFRVRIKLNSDEAIRRFDKIRQRGLQLSKAEIIETCRVLERDGKLENALFMIDIELLTSIQALHDQKIGEREFLGEAVMEFEKLLLPIRGLLCETRLAMQARQEIPKGLHLRAHVLAVQLHERSRALFRMRQTMRNEAAQARAAHTKAEEKGVWKWMGRIWFLGRTRKVRVVQEHHEREHLFTGIAWRRGEGCRCLDYY